VNWFDLNTADRLSDGPVAPSWTKDGPTRDDVLERLLGQLESVLGYLYPAGFADPKARKFYIGSTHGEAGESLSVELRGPKAGLWHDFATGEGGDIFDLWKAARGLSSFREVLQDAGDYTGAAINTPRRTPKRKNPKGGEAWGVPSAVYRYQDANGHLVAEIERFDWEKDGERKKTFRPWDVARRSYTHPETRPLYNLPNIIRAPEIVICEGEKAADALIAQNIDATTAMGGSNAPLEKTDWSPLQGRKVVIWPDNDQAGKDYASRLKTHLEGIGARTVSILTIPATRPEKWDAADAVEAGEDPRALIRAMRGQTADAERDGVPHAAPFRSWEELDPRQLPARQFLYGNHYIRKFASVTVAPGGLGKSTLVLVECIAMATGRDLLGIRPNSLCKVIYFNAEDPLDEIQRRVLAICDFFSIPQRELIGQLFINAN